MNKNLPLELQKLHHENTSLREDCNICQESTMGVGSTAKYNSVIVCKIGSTENGWFATLSPKTGGNPEEDFTIQLMTQLHFTHFSQLSLNSELAKNYGIILANACSAMTTIMLENPQFKALSETRETGISLATYGKCTTWKEKKEHLHLKLFPFRGLLGQPSTVDSSFERKEIERDEKGEFVRMMPIRKKILPSERFEYLSRKLIELMNHE
ncbi:hypothetical protein J4421_05525 [Candidatus Woesearchaeota archaeon]|nr:hypothetical protein [Candidatus Woesearchaeota archaeon]